VLEAITFAEGIEIALALVGDPEVEITDRDPELKPAPQIVLFASGEATEGELDWLDARSGELLFRLRWDLLGRTTLMPRGEELDEDALR
jgi:general secretion pathway protein H